MKLLRYGPRGQEEPGLLDAEGRIRDLSGVLADHGHAEISPEGIDGLKTVDEGTMPKVAG